VGKGLGLGLVGLGLELELGLIAGIQRSDVWLAAIGRIHARY